MRKILGCVAVALSFVVGFVLAPHGVRQSVAPACTPGAADAGDNKATAHGGGKRGGAPAAAGAPSTPGLGSTGTGRVIGSPGSLSGEASGAPPGGGGTGDGDVSGGGTSDASGTTVAKGGAGTISGGDDADGGGDSSGHGRVKLGDGTSQPDAPPPTAESDLKTAPPPPGMTDGPALAPGLDLPALPHASGDRVVGAKDYRYDRTGLPRYPSAVDRVASSMVLPPGTAISDQRANAAATLTRDAPETVTAWYRAHLPAGWVEQAPPPESTENRLRAEAAAHPAGESPLDSLFRGALSSQLQQMQGMLAKLRATHLAFFWPPDRHADSRSVMIVVDQKTGETAIMLTRGAAAP